MERFSPGQKVWVGKKTKGKVLDPSEYTLTPTPPWAVQVEIKDSEGEGWVNFVHRKVITPRKKVKYSTLEVELSDEACVFLFKEMCRLDLRPSKYITLILNDYLDNHPELSPEKSPELTPTEERK